MRDNIRKWLQSEPATVLTRQGGTDKITKTPAHRRSWFPFPLELEDCCCPICSANETDRLLSFDAFGFPTGIVECLCCGMVYVNPRPTRGYMENFYRKWFRLFYEGRRRVNEKYIQEKKWREWDLSRVVRYAKHLESSKRMLDIGCGAGYFAAQVQHDNPGCAVVGIEPDAMMAGFARNNLNLKVYEGFYETYRTTERYDVVTAFHVIEHLFDLDGFFEFLRGHLTESGKVIIETPNVDGNWRGTGMFHIAHLYTFSPRTISALFDKHGFEILEVGPLENDLDYSNLYLVARVSCGRSHLSVARDPKESTRIAKRCDSVAKVRAVRVMRNWVKMAYFASRYGF